MLLARKPTGPTARARARKKRKDEAYAQKIREQVVERDGVCRYGLDVPSATRPTWCWGYGEHAHFEARRKFKTRGMAPEARHTTADSLMLCTFHHKLYDARELIITAQTEARCDGPLDYVERKHTRAGDGPLDYRDTR